MYYIIGIRLYRTLVKPGMVRYGRWVWYGTVGRYIPLAHIGGEFGNSGGTETEVKANGSGRDKPKLILLLKVASRL